MGLIKKYRAWLGGGGMRELIPRHRTSGFSLKLKIKQAVAEGKAATDRELLALKTPWP
jgi:hypothetical protein